MTTATQAAERLLASVLREIDRSYLIGAMDGPGSEHTAARMFSHSPRLLEALRLGLAWQNAEAALPEGVVDIHVIRLPNTYLVQADTTAGWFTGEGPTPADALDALTTALRSEKP